MFAYNFFNSTDIVIWENVICEYGTIKFFVCMADIREASMNEIKKYVSWQNLN